MELVKNINDILENAKIFDKYLEEGTSDEKEFAITKIASGMCFVVIKDKEDYKFYPSKYIGYKNNSVANYYEAYFNADALPGEEKYECAAMYTFDGRMSNKAINKLLGCTCEKNYEMSEKFIDFCNKYGLKGSYKRKFWMNVIEI